MKFSSNVKTRFRFFFVLLSILLIAHRAPAPIVEQPENPTPAPQTSAPEQETTKSLSKSKKKSTENVERTKSEEPAKPKESAKPRERFGGTWTGKINQGVIGEVVFTLTFANGGSQVTEHTSFGTYSHAVTSNGQTATWKTGLLSEIDWTFTPNSDGNTAHVTAKSALGVNGDTTFHRGGAPAVARPPAQYPTAKAVPEKPGFVYNPFDPTSRIFIDVRGKPSGSKLVDPKSGKTFIVP